MKRVERDPDPISAQLLAFQGFQAGLWTCLPGIIIDVQADKMTCSVQPAIKAVFTDTKGVKKDVQLPPLIFCPLMFPAGGGFSLTFPVAAGDECLVIFASRCIDNWWLQGGSQTQAEMRMHDLSDGFAFVGIRSVPHALPDWSQNAVQLRSDDGTAKMAIGTDGIVRVTAAGQIILTAPTVIINGNLSVSGNVIAAGDVIGAGISLETHVHDGVEDGTDTSGPPVP